MSTLLVDPVTLPPASPVVPAATDACRWTRRHVIDSSQLSYEEIQWILRNAKGFADVLQRPVKKTPTLRGKVVVNLFYENSTRTRTSFELAAKYLSADTVNFAIESSSVKKGESLLDTAETLLAMQVDTLVIRHSSSGVCHQLAQTLGNRVAILNAGDGTHDHPSQGLLDLYSLLDHLQVDALAGKKIAIVGDILHSRVARSNVHLLQRFGAEVHLAGPVTLLPEAIDQLGCNGCQVHTTLAPAIQDADVVMALRLQKERQQGGLIPSLAEYVDRYGITTERLRQYCKPDVLVMHPGPMNRGVEIASDVADDKRISLITSQVTSGVAIRMALLYLVNTVPMEGAVHG
jgi:aspartate carbamoyltransferase catalytic subunit